MKNIENQTIPPNGHCNILQITQIEGLDTLYHIYTPLTSVKKENLARFEKTNFYCFVEEKKHLRFFVTCVKAKSEGLRQRPESEKAKG